MRSHDNLRNNPGLSSLITGEPGTQSPFELAPAGLLVDDNNIEGFILHCQLAASGEYSHMMEGWAGLRAIDNINYQELQSENITTLETWPTIERLDKLDKVLAQSFLCGLADIDVDL